jgi:glycosyltransferase involved in cell wall biosynthesis
MKREISKGHRILFLYTELAGYVLACAEELSKHPEVGSVDIIHYPKRKEAPFQFLSQRSYSLHSKQDLGEEGVGRLASSINPTAVVCSSWRDPEYIKVAKTYNPHIPVVLGFDNWWTGSIKQRLAAALSPFLIQSRFNKAWVPGKPQAHFAEKLGFTVSNLAFGLYSADAQPFLDVYQKRRGTIPSKKIIYVGRYLAIKGLPELWAAFSKLSANFPEWELHCMGAGALWEDRVVHPKIFHHGFKQPHELPEFLADAACFVMPSHNEPWGVVLHEMAISGLPLIASPRVGSAAAFLEHGKNGYVCEPNDLEGALRSFFTLDLDSRMKMSEHSHELGMKHNPKIWADSLIHLIT